MSVKHAAYKFPFRSPAPEGFVEKALYSLGTIFRGVGSAMDEMGAMIQGPGAVHETG